MRKVWLLIGWLSWIALFIPIKIVLGLTRRTKVIIVVDGQILLVKSWFGANHWSLPGGGMHRSEEAKQAAVREVFEETEVKLQPNQLTRLTVSHKQTKIPRNTIFFSTSLNKKLDLAKRPFFDEITDVAWIPLSDIKKHRTEKYIPELLSTYEKQR